VVDTETYLCLGKSISYCDTCRTYKADRYCTCQVSSVLLSNLFASILASYVTPHVTVSLITFIKILIKNQIHWINPTLSKLK
jgi:hypothetical protein